MKRARDRDAPARGRFQRVVNAEQSKEPPRGETWRLIVKYGCFLAYFNAKVPLPTTVPPIDMLTLYVPVPSELAARL